ALPPPIPHHLAEHNPPHPHTPPSCHPFATLQTTDALPQRSHLCGHTAITHARSPFLTRRHSVVVNSPSPRACLAASTRRWVSIRPRHSRIASATGCEASPS